jgi:hypothetical protein
MRYLDEILSDASALSCRRHSDRASIAEADVVIGAVSFRARVHQS